MKITWCNEERTKAIVQRGFWWWKKFAAVESCEQKFAWNYSDYLPPAYISIWRYVLTEHRCPDSLSIKLYQKQEWEDARVEALQRDATERYADKVEKMNWSPDKITDLPTAVAIIKEKP